jgi:hypothetical protein
MSAGEDAACDTRVSRHIGAALNELPGAGVAR